MSIAPFDLFNSRLKTPVGNNLENKPDDVRLIRRTLENFGLIAEEDFEREPDQKPLGLITRRLDTAIKSFQKDNDLRVDGLIYPDGETENKLLEIRKAREPELKPLPLAVTASPRDVVDSPFKTTASGITINRDALGQKIGEFLLAQGDKSKSTEEPLPPFVVVAMLIYIGMGVLSRLMPQVQVFILALPLQIMLSMLTLALVISSAMLFWLTQFEGSMTFFLKSAG